MSGCALLAALLLLAAGPALAQRAGRPAAADRFHEAARLFVAGDTARAARAAEAGLALAPGDPRLRALLAEIRRRPPPQPPRSGGGGQDRQQDRPPEDQPPDRQQNPPRDRADRPEQDRPEDAPRPQDPGRDERDDAGRPQPGPERRPPPQTPPTHPGAGTPDARSGRDRADTPPAGGRPSRMTRAEAEALLRALGADERRLLRARQRPTQPREVEKDW